MIIVVIIVVAAGTPTVVIAIIVVIIVVIVTRVPAVDVPLVIVALIGISVDRRMLLDSRRISRAITQKDQHSLRFHGCGFFAGCGRDRRARARTHSRADRGALAAIGYSADDRAHSSSATDLGDVTFRVRLSLDDK